MSIHLAIFGKPRYLGLLDIETPFPPRGTWLVVETMRGSELALLGGPLSNEQEARYRASCNDDASDGQVKGGEPILQEISLVRTALDEDLAAAELERKEENEVLVRARTLLRSHNLSMKLVDVEYLLDKKKLFFYFTSEQRVDFRAYVRDLAKEFKTRIELRQIGVRDEAKTVKGIAPCGRECCCSHWLHKFTPICIKMVKEQNLALNPTKISGICGRLMCCMSYEHTSYSRLWKTLPNPGSKIRTPAGNYIVEGVELSSDSVRVRRPDGGSLLIVIEDFPRFKETVLEGKEWEEPSRTLRDFSSGKSLFDSPAAKTTRSFSDDSSRSSRKRTADSGGREKGQEQSPLAKDKKTETPGAEKNRREKEKKLPEGVRGPEEAAKSAKKKRRRKKPSASADIKTPQGGAQQTPQQERGDRKPVEGKKHEDSSQGDRTSKKNTSAEKNQTSLPTEKSDGAPLPPEKNGETPGRRSSSSRRRRSGKGGGNREPNEKRNTPDQRTEGSESKNASPGAAPQKRHKNKAHTRPKEEFGEHSKETGHE